MGALLLRSGSQREDVPDALKPPPGNPRFPLMDGLRAVAVLLVLAFHATGAGFHPEGRWWGRYAAHLDVGVTVFFVISGFLLYRPFVASRLQGTPRPRLLTYARRRALRIVPAYWLALTVLAIYPGLGGVFTEDWWVYYGFLQIYRSEWVFVFQGLVQAWSLCVEVTFYIALPLLAACLTRLPTRSRKATVRNELLTLGVLSLATFAVRLAWHSTDPLAIGPQTLPELFDWFAIGMVLAVVSVALRQHKPWPVLAVVRYPLACWISALVLFVLLAQINGSNTSAVGSSATVALVDHLFYGLIAFFIALPAVFYPREGGLPRRLLTNTVVAWLGLISYGIFLWHVTVLAQLDSWGVDRLIPQLPFLSLFVTGLAVSTVCAALSYYLVERPLLRFKR